MPWKPQETLIFLVLDNAGGHGTRATIEEYTRMVREENNVIIKFQPACSPEISALDLGIWMSLQSEVECRHRNGRRDAQAGPSRKSDPSLD